MMIMRRRRRRIIIVMIHTFSIALFPAERAPDEDGDKGASRAEITETQKISRVHVQLCFVSSAVLKQCVFKFK